MVTAMTREAFIAEAHALCRLKSSLWSMREVAHPLESATSPYLYAHTALPLGNNDHRTMHNTTRCIDSTWNDDDEDCDDVRGAATHTTSHTLLVDVFVALSHSYQLPVFFLSGKVSTVRDGVPSMTHASISDFASVMPGVADYSRGEDESVLVQGEASRQGSPKLIVSEGYSEELGHALFSVHPCDMETLLELAAECLGPLKERTTSTSHPDNESGAIGEEGELLLCSSLFRLVRMVGPLLGLDPTFY